MFSRRQFFLTILFLTFTSQAFAGIKFVDVMGSGILLYMGPGGRMELKNDFASINIKRGDEDVTDATFTINGVPLKVSNPDLGGFMVDENKKIPNLGAGKTLLFEAKSGADTAKLEITCPADFKVTAPVEGADYTPGTKVKVAWEGTFKPAAANDYGPKAQVTVSVWDSANKIEKASGGFPKFLDMGGMQGGEVDLPKGTMDFQNGPLVKFIVPGEPKEGIRCTLVKNVVLKISK